MALKETVSNDPLALPELFVCKNWAKHLSSDPVVVPDIVTGNSRLGREWAQRAPNSSSLPPVCAGRGSLGMLRWGPCSPLGGDSGCVCQRSPAACYTQREAVSLLLP